MPYILVKQGLDILEREIFSEEAGLPFPVHTGEFEIKRETFIKLVSCLDTCSQFEHPWQLLTVRISLPLSLDGAHIGNI